MMPRTLVHRLPLPTPARGRATRIAYFVHGRGRGHASRALSSLPRLRRAGFEVWPFASGAAWPWLSEQGAREVALCAPGGGMARAFVGRLRSDVAQLRALAPDILVSDGDGPSACAAFALGIPSVAVGHGLLFAHCRLPRGLSFRDVLHERLNVLPSTANARRRVAVHFAALAPRTRGTQVARPDLPEALSHVTRSRRGGFLLAYFRDPKASGDLAQLVAHGYRVVCFGDAGAPVAGVDYRGLDAEAFASLLVHADGVVGSAGNHLPAECAMLGVPMLALHAPGDAEHTMNARLIEHAGIGLAAPFGGVGRVQIETFERMMRTDHAALSARTRALTPASEAIARACEELRGEAHATRRVREAA